MREKFVRLNPILAEKLGLPTDSKFTFQIGNKKALEVRTSDASWDYSQNSKPFFDGKAKFIGIKKSR